MLLETKHFFAGSKTVFRTNDSNRLQRSDINEKLNTKIIEHKKCITIKMVENEQTKKKFKNM